ncbi:MAG: hypothetical protein AABY22_35525 [Nanoarchaeota archaeon]
MNLLIIAIVLLVIGFGSPPIWIWASWNLQKENQTWAATGVVWTWIITFPLAFLLIVIYASQIDIPIGLPIGPQFTIERGWQCDNQHYFCKNGDYNIAP